MIMMGKSIRQIWVNEPYFSLAQSDSKSLRVKVHDKGVYKATAKCEKALVKELFSNNNWASPS